MIGDYSFENPIQIGDRLYFEDMAIYSFVKIIPLTVLGFAKSLSYERAGDCSLVKAFDYQDFKGDYHDRQSKKIRLSHASRI